MELFIEVCVEYLREKAISSDICPFCDSASFRQLPPPSAAYFLLAFAPHGTFHVGGGELFTEVWVGFLRKNAICSAIYPFSRFRQLP